MKIKTKLVLNVMVVIVIVACFAATGIIGMRFIKSKLVYLTEQSTPFQMRTIELQKSIQSAIAELVKVGTSKTTHDFVMYRAGAEKALSEVKNAEEMLGSLSGTKSDTYDELHKVADELIQVTGGRLKAEDDALSANRAVAQRIKDASTRLNSLNISIRKLQNTHSSAFKTSINDTNGMLAKLRKIEGLKSNMKDLRLALVEMQKAHDKKAFDNANNELSAAVTLSQQNDYLKESKGLNNVLKKLIEKIDEMTKLQASNLNHENASAQSKYEEISSEVMERLLTVTSVIDQEVHNTGNKYAAETKKQGDTFTQSTLATRILTGSAELTALGESLDGLSTRLLTLSSIKDIDNLSVELKKTSEKINVVNQSLKQALSEIGAKEELNTLKNVESALSSIKSMFIADDGIISKIRNQIEMKEKARQATEKLMEIVLKQSEKGNKTVVAARGEQEKAISRVNYMVNLNTILICIISIAAVVFGLVFGTAVYRSISRPLMELVNVSNNVAQGDLTSQVDSQRKDEVGIVQAHIATMVGNLRGIAGKIKNACGNLADNSQKLSETASVLEAGARQQTLQAEQSSVAMMEMSQTTMDVAKNVANTAETAMKMKQIAQSGKDAMSSTMGELTKFTDKVKESAQKVESLGQKSEEINNIIFLIKDIADQTNLLALNAAIEAARAGEHGMGFAVVAQNVRDLANKTTVATDDIAKTIKGMQSEVAGSVTFMKEENKSLELVLKHVTTSIKSIEEITCYVEQVSDMVQRIAVATEEQTSTSEGISHNIDNATSMMRQLNDSVAEIKRASESLLVLAGDLNTMGSWFKV